MPGRTCVSCVSQRAGACGSLATIAADCRNAVCRDAKSGGVKRGSTTKSSPKIVPKSAINRPLCAVAMMTADALVSRSCKELGDCRCLFGKTGVGTGAG